MRSSFLKNVQPEPLRAHFSVTQLGVTPTVRGGRIPVGLSGVYVLLAASGFQYREKVETTTGGAAPLPLASLPTISPEQSLRSLERISQRPDWMRIYRVVSIVVVVIMLLPAPMLACLLAIALAIGSIWVRRWNDDWRTARLLYDVDDAAAMDRFALACTAGEALGACGGLWLVSSRISTSDLRRNAGAGTIVNRLRSHCVHNAIPNIETNLEAWSLFLGPLSLAFLPDRLLIHQDGRFTAIAYDQLAANVQSTSFVEEGPLPPDAHVIGSTWRYVCKDGTPDLRFSNNAQLPLVRYGQLTIRSLHGLEIVLQASRVAAAEQAAAALGMLSNLARTGFSMVMQQSATPRAQMTPPASVAAPPSRRKQASPVAPTLAMDAMPEAPREITPAPPVVAPVPTPAPPSIRPAKPAAIQPIPPTPVVSASVAVPIVPVSSPAVAHNTPPPAAATGWSAGDACWVSFGKSVTVAGYKIDCGMVYVGTNLVPVYGYLSGAEPALINPRLKVDAQPNRTGEGMPYWPSYSEIKPADRAAYLEWLASGRSAKDAYIGYVFIFFYGLERRLLADGRQRSLPPEERNSIIAEVRRLLSIYGSNKSFRSYATDFLTLATALAGGSRIYHEIPEEIPSSSEFPLTLRLAFGQLAADGVPVPAEWAYLWMVCGPGLRLGVVAQRCAAEMKQLFITRYGKLFGKGIQLERRGRDIQAQYRPASASFGGELRIDIEGVPDVMTLQGHGTKLYDLMYQCAGDLDAFSRYLGRNAKARGSLAAMALLPSEILTNVEGSELTPLCDAIEKSLAKGSTATLATREILRGKRTKGEFVTIAQLLQRRGYGLEPDVRFGGPLPDAEGSVIVFRLPTDAPTSPSPEYHAVALLMHLATVIAVVDDQVGEAEEKQLRNHLEDAMHLSASERARVDAHVQWLLREKPGLAGVKKRLAILEPDKRGKIADFVVAVACADGRVTPAEIKALVKMAPMLGLDEAAMYRRIHALSAAATPAADEPVTVKPSESGRGYAIAPPASGAASEIRIDMARVGKLMEDTKNVALMLDKIFVAEEEPAPPPPPPPSGAAIGNLGLQESAFLRKLAARDTWSRGDVESLAAELGLLPDGALEAINDAAFEVAGAPLCAGDDPVEVDQDIAKELMK